ncbi:glycosyltransferase family 4 protein [Flavobacterium sp. RSP15]|uniref:glycosyltransferase family 4 protein n=1 Tax=Flavobacterium sp. RSP15 TaxID=2497485 RepID=UPI000F84CB14|nr:glycosyltransferase [Flavobacterium sp. RSP15]RTY86016.1 glycosyltransferase family 1 protein [Flavobacterium sp. RSP15]
MGDLKILYLYSELMGYQIHVFNEYVENYNADVHVIHWDHKKLTPYVPPVIKGVSYYNRSETDYKAILELCNKIHPDIIYISGWMDKDYLKVTMQMKLKGIPIVVGFDDIWYGTLRQKAAVLIFPILYKKYFSHAWVAGPYQFEYAKRLGFKNSKIIFDLLSANTQSFDASCNTESDKGKRKYFLYVGRLSEAKNIDKLVEGFKIYKEVHKGNWGLVCVGNGNLKSTIDSCTDIKYISFSTESELKELARSAGAFVLASKHEPWGLVVHEFASMGLPLLVSDKVGSKPIFFVNGFNGFGFSCKYSEDIALKMKAMSDLTEEELAVMGLNSRLLANRINVKTSAANFISILRK